MKEIIIKGVTFQYCKEWVLNLNARDIITPIWKYGKIRMLLITSRRTGKSFYITANTGTLNINVDVRVVSSPHGTTYVLREDSTIEELTTMISFFKAGK